MGDRRTPQDRSERFGLPVPTVSAAPPPELDLRPRAVEHWLNQLPLADARESAARITVLLRVANGSALAPRPRFCLADQLRAPVLSLVDTLIREATRRGLPLAERALPLVDGARVVLDALTDAYKLVFVDLLSNPGQADPDLLAHAAQRALRLLTRNLEVDYHLYAPPAAGRWRQLHRLFGLVETRDLAGRRVVDALQPRGRDSAGGAYRAALLLALSGPYRLPAAELPRLQAFVQRYADEVDLRPEAPDSCRFRVVIDSDHPPVAAAPAGAPTICVELGGVIAAARADLARGDDELLARLLADWSHPPRRSFGRQPYRTRVRVVFGLGAVHRTLAPPPAPSEQPPAPPAVPPLELAAQAEAGSAAEREHRGDNDRHFAAGLRTYLVDRRRSRRSLPGPVYREHTVATEDISAGGYRLLWEQGTAAAEIGEMLALWDEASARWAVGAVRWMQSLQSGAVRIGVEMIAPGAEPARVQRSDRETVALRLPPLAALAQPESLLTEAGAHRVGNVLRLRVGECTQRIRLTAILEATRCFTRFAYEPLGAAPRAVEGDGLSLAPSAPS